MTTPAYLYDIATAPAPTLGVIQSGVAGCLVGVLLLVLVWKRPESGPRRFGLAWIAGWAVFSAWQYQGIAERHREAQAWLASGVVDVAEGPVQDFTPATASQNGIESFRVGNKFFQVEDGGTRKPGLNRGSTRGGPVHKGMRLRVTYRGDAILRVEEKGAAPAPEGPVPAPTSSLPRG